MDHGHVEMSTRGLKITALLTGIYFVIELSIGLWTGSISVISDAFHTFSAVGGVLVALVAGYFAKKGPNLRQTYGLIRAEIIGALFNGLFLTGMAILVLVMGIMRLMEPIELPTGPMLLVALGGLITEVIGIALLYTDQKKNLNIRGAFWHVMQTFIGSIIIIVSAVVIRFTGFLAIDPLLGMFFGLVLFWASWKIIRDALHILLERVPSDADVKAMVDGIRGVGGVEGLHHVHAWSLSSGRNIFSAHVLVQSLTNSQNILKEIHNLLREKFGIYFSTIQVEEKCLDEESAPEIEVSIDSP